MIICTYLYVIHWHWIHSQQHCNSCQNEAYLIHIFSEAHITAFLCWQTLDSTSALCLGAILKSTKMRKTWHQLDHGKAIFHSTTAGPRRQSTHRLVQPQLGTHLLACWLLWASSLMTTKVPPALILVTDTFMRVGEFATMESVHNQEQLHAHPTVFLLSWTSKPSAKV